MNNNDIAILEGFICLCLPPDMTWHKVNDSKVGLKWGLEEGKVGHEPRFDPCLATLVICSLSAMWAWWAQIWVQALMPDYSLNWTAKSSAIQGGKKLSMLQLAHPKVAQPKLGAFRPQVCLCWTALTSVKANSKLMPSWALSCVLANDWCYILPRDRH